jgi:hypothetical protein
MTLRVFVLVGLTALLPVEKDATELLIAMSVAILMTLITLVADYTIHLSDRTKVLLFILLLTSGMQYFAPVLNLTEGQNDLPYWQDSIMMPMCIAILLFWWHCATYCHPVIRQVPIVPVETIPVMIPEQETEKQQYYENPLLYAIQAKNVRMA